MDEGEKTMGIGPYDLSKAMVDAIESSVTSSADVMVCNATTGKALMKRGLAVAVGHGAFALTTDGVAERDRMAARDAGQERRNAEAGAKLAADMAKIAARVWFDAANGEIVTNDQVMAAIGHGRVKVLNGTATTLTLLWCDSVSSEYVLCDDSATGELTPVVPEVTPEPEKHTADCLDRAAYRAYVNEMIDVYPSPEATQAGKGLLNSGLTDCICGKDVSARGTEVPEETEAEPGRPLCSTCGTRYVRRGSDSDKCTLCLLAEKSAAQGHRHEASVVPMLIPVAPMCECGSLGCSHSATECLQPATVATLCEGCHVRMDLALPGTCDVAQGDCPTLRRIGDLLALRGWAVSNSVIADVMRLPYPGRRTVEAVADRIMEVSGGVARVPFDWAAGLTDVANLPTATEYVALLAGSVATVKRLPRKVKKSMGAQRGRHGRKGR